MSLQSQVFTSAGTFTVPANVTAVMLQLVGPGGGGRGQAGSGFGSLGHSGSSSEFALNVFTPVTAGATVAITVGTGGVGVSGNTAPNAGSGNAAFGTVVALPARNATQGYPSAPTGNGGGVGGGDSHNQVDKAFGTAESVTYFGGCGGALGGDGATPNGSIGNANGYLCGGPVGPPYIAGVRNYPGSGGSANVWPVGGTGGTGALVAGTNSTSGAAGTGYGSGGGGGGDGESFGAASSGGNGAKGAVIVYWFGP